ncbi:Disp Complex Protein Lrch3 [Manis pentadactyla]|nr:Disp Complex Protein Lrch3 [Manis pentadactyla]
MVMPAASTGMIWYRIDIGAIFCQVKSSMPDDSGLPCVTSGTQKWNGAIPSFMAIAVVMIADEVSMAEEVNHLAKRKTSVLNITVTTKGILQNDLFLGKEIGQNIYVTAS